MTGGARSASVAHLVGGHDTIAAIATAEGRGAIALIRIAGPLALDVAQKLGAPADLIARHATRVSLVHPMSGDALDDALVTAFIAPHSYTGDNVVEVSTHGGTVVPALVLAACFAAGARPALPGEFTRRALLNGRLDLLQAEAVGDLVNARTRAMHAQAIAQLDGGLSRRLGELRTSIIALEAMLAYDIDFPEEDDGPISPARVASAIDSLLTALDALIATAPRAALVRDGALVVIAGPPNAGKSSLFNAMLGEARALVTDIPGTTRDAIEALLDTPQVPLRLVDTAGLRSTADIVERLGIEVSERYVGHAQVVLACAEDGPMLVQTVERVRALTNGQIIAVLTKADTHSALLGTVAAAFAAASCVVIAVSAETGAGIRALLSAIQTLAVHGTPASTDGMTLTRERHVTALLVARDEVAHFHRAWADEHIPAVIAAVHLRAATHALDELIGAVSLDDVLDRLFADFCVGK